MVPNLERRAGAHALMIRSFPADPSLEGKRLDEVGRIKGMDPLDAAIEMLIAGGAPTHSFNMSDADVEAIMPQPWPLTTTDGGLPPFGQTSDTPPASGPFPPTLPPPVPPT